MAEVKIGQLLRWSLSDTWVTASNHKIMPGETALVKEVYGRRSVVMLHWDGKTSKWGAPLGYWTIVGEAHE